MPRVTSVLTKRVNVTCVGDALRNEESHKVIHLDSFLWIQNVGDEVGHEDKVAGNWELDGNKSSERWWFV